MSLTAPQEDSSERDLRAVLQDLADEVALPARTLAHAWTAAGGAIQVGHYTIRLLAPGSGGDAPLTAGFIHFAHEGPRGPALELCRARMVGHGVEQADWVHWASELLELQPRGFDPAAKYPRIALEPVLPPSEMVLLVGGLRDLARMLHAP